MVAKVMVVEDEVVLCRFLIDFLEGIGYAACGAESGQEALDLFVEERPSLVLLDIKLPDIDGLEVLQQLKQMDPSCKAVVMSSYGNVRTVVKAMKRGAETYLTKPTPLPAPKPAARHTVVKGDTLYSLGRRYGTSVGAIQRANGITGTLIRIGQTLKIPR